MEDQFLSQSTEGGISTQRPFRQLVGVHELGPIWGCLYIYICIHTYICIYKFECVEMSAHTVYIFICT